MMSVGIPCNLMPTLLPRTSLHLLCINTYYMLLNGQSPIDPLHVCGNAAKLEDKTKEISTSVKKSCSVLLIGCIPTDVQGVYSKFGRLTFMLNCDFELINPYMSQTHN